MGKDSDRRGSTQTKVSRDDLKADHVRLVQREKELAQQFLEVKGVFQKLEEAYLSSKGTFSVQRYGQLKEMIKGATSDATINSIKGALNGPSTGESGKGGLAALLQKAKDFSSESQQQQSQQTSDQSDQASGSKKSSGKMSSFMKKLKDFTGFSDEPVADEDVMSDADLQRDTARKQRAIQHHTNQFSRALTKLEKLREAYQASKAHAPPKRYQELKEMIKAAVADKFT
ncbi:uncharacterized protein LOC101863434 [Aplysia californica]|uniref:Uncharacterized protein LOC101863434 n=1 Tax=Aplysia californica TaxID=6500 RepID=A0ABM0ZZL1_APLCA|nr:uncharacterized protein LOC101863434 [Aplysia californica]